MVRVKGRRASNTRGCHYRSSQRDVVFKKAGEEAAIPETSQISKEKVKLKSGVEENRSIKNGVYRAVTKYWNSFHCNVILIVTRKKPHLLTELWIPYILPW